MTQAERQLAVPWFRDLLPVSRINRVRQVLLPGSFPVGPELLDNLATAIRYSLLAAMVAFMAVLSLVQPNLARIQDFLVAIAFLGLSAWNLFQVKRGALEAPSDDQVRDLFIGYFVALHLLALLLASQIWYFGPALSAYGELSLSLVIIVYCVLFAVAHSAFPLSVALFCGINGLSISLFWALSQYPFKWALALLNLVFFLLIFAVSLSFGRTLRRSLLLQKERDDARLRAEHAARGLEQALESLKHANADRLRLFAAANHDLRQPISAISLFVGVLQRKIFRKYGMDDEMDDLFVKVDRNIATLDVIVGALADITSLEAGSFKTKPKIFELRELVDNLVSEFEAQAETSGTSVQVNIAPLLLFSDPHMLGRILRNILDNAFKYAPGTPVLISVSSDAGPHRARPVSAGPSTQQPSTAPELGLFLSVQDGGPGIPPGMHAQVMGEYFQIDNPERDRKKGFGLGLSIAKGMAQALGSSLNLVHRDGKGLEALINLTPLLCSPGQSSLDAVKGGSRFILRPQESEEPGSKSSRFEDDPGDLARSDLGRSELGSDVRHSILIVDDDDDVRAGLEALFQIWGQSVFGLANIGDALQYLESLSPETRPDLILVDNWLPDGRGLDAVQQFKDLCPTSAVVILTGDTDVTTLKRAHALNTEVLLKPVTAARLVRLLASLS